MSAIRSASTFFGCETLNRVSFLREDVEFVKSTLTHGSTTFVPFLGGEALSLNGSLYQIQLDDSPSLLQPLLHKLLPLVNTPAGRAHSSGVNLTFLGLKQGEEAREGVFVYRSQYKGTPYYGIDFRVDSETIIKPQDIVALTKMTPLNRQEVFEMNNEEASLYSHAKMYLDWLSKYNFCPGCGSPMYPLDAGTKLKCSNLNSQVNCQVRDARVTNVCFPRTDPVVIVAIASRDFSKICLARSKRKHTDTIMYSTIAGFMEPAETVENACRREIWEETGIRCDDVAMVTSQPWPYPVNLMIGCLGIVDANGINEVITLTHDEELLDAQWFSTEDVSKALDDYNGNGMVHFKDSIRLPGSTAVAFHLIKHVCDKYKRRQGSL
ncbi:NPY1 (YGL067W) [Zygosaccharomyces parabailii]|uniref:NAD(+) diphosphatase n=1 Tax=Zygosaccharomyces bailii (strain CLIB 213 / ATCC 58445 / CBS 680 / BCRC 21525 / NBRC 1098 / NCYC 1416 / NRRL Y-2227) TaxID=1333698 RepID=A0A8J2T3U7_ZYGB2|nr:NPY1 (YGL067W) [Zygosaccharomyces parabailii]CDF87901.1 BN860_17040g1_1 [Zygosaccharomyces bailii CLIB 213]CDH17956.1 probable NADH pyrophosphatase [Zygosaccharomyces bailii ISA1307]SJM83738.1 probable NADH pyrophosphatase [Zygosaccharomyces bailii]